MMASGYLSILLLVAALASAAPLQPTFSSCESYYSPAAGINRLNVSSIYANLVSGSRAAQLGLAGEGSDVLRLDLIGEVGSQVLGFDESTNKLATLFTDTSVGGISVYKSTSWVCNSLFPATLPTPYTPNTTYCPLSAGPFGINISIPLYRNYALTTLSTQIRVVDTSLSANTLACINVSFTPYDRDGWYYDLLLWLPATLAIGFWLTSWGARFAAGWVVGSGVAEYGVKDQQGETRGKELDKAGRRDARMRKWGTMLVSGLSGERLSVSSALLRFVTPGLRDIIFHIQFCTILVMIAVNWPGFAYPIVARLAWADLVWNSTIIAGSSPRIITYPTETTLPSAFSSQMSNDLYPLYLDTNTFNPLLNLGTASPGLESFASAVGLRPQDIFGTCLAIFLIIAAAVIIISILIWTIHATAETLAPERKRTTPVAAKRQSYGTVSSPGTSIAGDKLYDGNKSAPPTPGFEREMGQLPIANSQEHPTRKGPSRFRKAWFRFKPKGEAGAFHAAALYGNLLRLILIFHLPVTVFSTYQLVLGSRASVVSRVFAALALIFISILIPAGVMWKVYRTPSGKLYDATRTLLAMGTMYNHYVMDKQLFRVCPLVASLVVGVVIGAGQGSGIAQAVILIVVELIMLVVPAVWYPWGEGASMGAPSVFKGVFRVISALLVMLLSPVFGMTEAARTWLAYTALILNAIVFLFFVFMLLTKLLEGLIRLIGGAHFDESTHPLDGGIFAAIADLDCLNGVTGGKAAARKRRKRGSRQLQRNVSAAGGLTTQRMLDKYSEGVMRPEPGSPSYDAGSAGFSPYPRMSDGYFPTVGSGGGQPPLGPPPMERHSSDRTEEAGGGNIMDAWRTRSNEGYNTPGSYAPTVSPGIWPTGQRLSPPAGNVSYGYATGPGHRTSPPPEAFGRSFSVVRGSKADMDHPYDVRRMSAGGMGMDMGEFGRSLSPPPVRVARAPMPSRPMHQREYSSPVIIESFDAITPGLNGSAGGPSQSRSRPTSGIYSTFPSAGAGGNKRHSGGTAMEAVELVPLRPPEMTIPKRRSLNDLKHEHDSAGSGDESDSYGGKGKGKGKGRAGTKGRGKRQWFSRTAADEDETEESDDEPGPDRSRLSSSRTGTGRRGSGLVNGGDGAGGEDGGKKGWKSRLGIGRRKGDELDEEAKDENKARKDALANESGALFAGVESPAKRRKEDKAQAQAQAAAASRMSQAGPSGSGEGKKGFVVLRKGPISPSPSSQPRYDLQSFADPIAQSRPGPSSTVDASGETTRSFRVKRMTRPTPTSANQADLPVSTHPSPQDFASGTTDKSVYPTPPVPADRTGATNASGNVASGAAAEPPRSFRVIRKTPAAQPGGRESRPPVLDVPVVADEGGGGYSSDAFKPYGSTR